MSIKFPSDDWIKELARLLNASPAYEKAGKSWEGDFVFVVEPDDALPQPAYLYLDLFHGKSREAAQMSSRTERIAQYTLSAPFGTWRQVTEGKLNPIQGLMTRKLKIQGDMLQIMRYPKAVKEIVDCCMQIPTE